MRIAYVSDAVLPSTAAHAVATLQMTGALAELGHDVTLFAPWHRGRARDPAALRRDLALAGSFELRYLPYVELGARLGGSYMLVAAAAARLARALVYTRNVRIARIAARAGCPVILETHQPFDSPRQLAAARALAADPRLVRWIFISERLRARVAAQVDLPARCQVEHSAVDLARFTPMLERAAARRQLGLDPDQPLIVHAGNMYPGRGVELLIEATAALPDCRLVLVGGAARDTARVAALAGPRVTVVGHRPQRELPPYLFAADVLVMPTTADATTFDGRTRSNDWASPMKLFEYLAAGRAIVATDFPAVREVLVDGHNARVVPPDDLVALRDAIAAVLTDPATAARLGAQARADARQRDWRDRAARVLAGLSPRPGASHA